MGLGTAVLVIIVFVAGIGIGFYGDNILRPFVQQIPMVPTMWTSTLNMTIANVTITTIDIENVTVTMDANFPYSMIKEFGGSYLLSNKQIILEVQMPSSVYWTIIAVQETIYASGAGVVHFSYMPGVVGIYNIKAVFGGTNILYSTETTSQPITVTT